MTMIFEIEHHCDEMPVVKIKILEKTCWQKKHSWQTKDNVNRSTIFEPFVLSFMDMLESSQRFYGYKDHSKCSNLYK